MDRAELLAAIADGRPEPGELVCFERRAGTDRRRWSPDGPWPR